LNTAQYEPNVAIYERLGFKVGKFAEVNVEDDSIEVYYVKTSLIAGIWHVSGASASALIRAESIRTRSAVPLIIRKRIKAIETLEYVGR
jgi:hypothetical protein